MWVDPETRNKLDTLDMEELVVGQEDPEIDQETTGDQDYPEAPSTLVLLQPAPVQQDFSQAQE